MVQTRSACLFKLNLHVSARCTAFARIGHWWRFAWLCRHVLATIMVENMKIRGWCEVAHSISSPRFGAATSMAQMSDQRLVRDPNVFHRTNQKENMAASSSQKLLSSVSVSSAYEI